MNSKKFDDLFVNFLNISSNSSCSSSSNGSLIDSSEMCVSDTSISDVDTENILDNRDSEIDIRGDEIKYIEVHNNKKLKEILNSDVEHEITNKYVKSIIKNKERQKFYEFRKYLSDSNVFITFIQIFMHLIKNKENIKNPYDYIINYFKLNIDNYDNENKKALIEENCFYKKKNEELNNEINLLEIEIYDIQKRNCCNAITNYFFKGHDGNCDDEQLNAYEIFKKFIKKNEKLNTDPSFTFTKDTFFVFLNFLSDSTRTILHDIIMQKAHETDSFVFSDKLFKKLTKFKNLYMSFD